MQAAIVGVNVFYFMRLQFSRDGYMAPGEDYMATGSTAPSGYTSFPGDKEQSNEDDDEHRKQYSPPEY